MSFDSEAAETVLTAEGLVKTYGSCVALDGASVRLERGVVLAVMGPSGSGKSTLLHCLAGILPPDSGEVWFRGVPISGHTDAQCSRLRRREFGFVFQSGQLVPELSAEENIILPLLLDRAKSRRQALCDARHLLERLGLGGLGRRRPGQLSGGQAQRVAIARALVTKPSIIFADEPTGSLDSETGDGVMSTLIEAARQRSAAVMVVTHDPAVANRADQMIKMRDGRILIEPAVHK